VRSPLLDSDPSWPFRGPSAATNFLVSPAVPSSPHIEIGPSSAYAPLLDPTGLAPALKQPPLHTSKRCPCGVTSSIRRDFAAPYLVGSSSSEGHYRFAALVWGHPDLRPLFFAPPFENPWAVVRRPSELSLLRPRQSLSLVESPAVPPGDIQVHWNSGGSQFFPKTDSSGTMASASISVPKPRGRRTPPTSKGA